MRKRAVEQHNVSRHLCEFAAAGVVRTLGGGNQQTKQHGCHGSDQSHSKLHQVFGISVQMLLG
jgi:hypothetical protein